MPAVIKMKQCEQAICEVKRDMVNELDFARSAPLLQNAD